jgi:hypothetical protein
MGERIAEIRYQEAGGSDQRPGGKRRELITRRDAEKSNPRAQTGVSVPQQRGKTKSLVSEIEERSRAPRPGAPKCGAEEKAESLRSG